MTRVAGSFGIRIIFAVGLFSIPQHILPASITSFYAESIASPCGGGNCGPDVVTSGGPGYLFAEASTGDYNLSTYTSLISGRMNASASGGGDASSQMGDVISLHVPSSAIGTKAVLSDLGLLFVSGFGNESYGCGGQGCTWFWDSGDGAEVSALVSMEVDGVPGTACGLASASTAVCETQMFFPLTKAGTLVLDFSAYIEAKATGDASINIIDPITLSLPPGVTYTSASGVFLTDSSQVPEPSTGNLGAIVLTVMALVLIRFKKWATRTVE